MKKDPNKYPPGWNYRKTAAIARFYDEQHDEEIVAEIEAAANDKETVLVQVPRGLLPRILKLVEARRKSA
jgi:hypothetical protein